ncbi:MFS Git1p-like glycerophosphoinositol permease [Wolfiporia cocos MD-104 SS10]|uniref:MFS Git1p-like glycerophosphoinositol permease n=1 Tax=Wolfiporia cocos (strain MD-104) TaxID=742152 RepID=A0A2H3JXS4_WOLCO|nr:MFS Git1p-like glycerophosphoinositol permease [Wolfiporia cocos MD-104 SS10]
MAATTTYMAIFAAAFGLLSDGYHNNLMTMTNVVFKRLYPSGYTTSVSTRVSNALLVGEIIGQVLLGLICDRIGRKAGLVLTTLLIVVGATLCTAAYGAHEDPYTLFWLMTIGRGITGVGTGGEYPASSVSAIEAIHERSAENRASVYILVTDFPLVIGGPLTASVFLIVLSALGQGRLGAVWSVCFGVGMVFPLAVFAFRMRMLSSKLYSDSAIKRRVPYTLAIRKYWRALLGTCGAWMIFDFIYYPNAIFSATIISSVTANRDLRSVAEWQLLLGIIALPGVFIGILLCNYLGRRNTASFQMILGFSGYVIFGLIIGLAYERLVKIMPLFVIFYGLMASMGNLGPGNMTLVVSAESYPTSIRGTCFGLSAALGKTGAAIGTQVFTPIQDSLGQKWTFIVAAIFGILGMLVTYFFVPDKRGLDLACEDEEFLKYLSENGWDGVVGDRGGEIATSGDPKSSDLL